MALRPSALIGLLTVIAVPACATDPMIANMNAKSAALIAQAQASTLPSGWRVDCNYDQHLAVRNCFAVLFTEHVPFRIEYFNAQGPRITPGHHTYPGRVATIRVDNGQVTAVSDATATAIVAELKKGRTAYATYWVWPEGMRRMEVDISGFAEAYDALIRKVSTPATTASIGTDG